MEENLKRNECNGNIRGSDVIPTCIGTAPPIFSVYHQTTHRRKKSFFTKPNNVCSCDPGANNEYKLNNDLPEQNNYICDVSQCPLNKPYKDKKIKTLCGCSVQKPNEMKNNSGSIEDFNIMNKNREDLCDCIEAMKKPPNRRKSSKSLETIRKKCLQLCGIPSNGENVPFFSLHRLSYVSKRRRRKRKKIPNYSKKKKYLRKNKKPKYDKVEINENKQDTEADVDKYNIDNETSYNACNLDGKTKRTKKKKFKVLHALPEHSVGLHIAANKKTKNAGHEVMKCNKSEYVETGKIKKTNTATETFNSDDVTRQNVIKDRKPSSRSLQILKKKCLQMCGLDSTDGKKSLFNIRRVSRISKRRRRSLFTEHTKSKKDPTYYETENAEKLHENLVRSRNKKERQRLMKSTDQKRMCRCYSKKDKNQSETTSNNIESDGDKFNEVISDKPFRKRDCYRKNDYLCYQQPSQNIPFKEKQICECRDMTKMNITDTNAMQKKGKCKETKQATFYSQGPNQTHNLESIKYHHPNSLSQEIKKQCLQFCGLQPSSTIKSLQSGVSRNEKHKYKAIFSINKKRQRIRKLETCNCQMARNETKSDSNSRDIEMDGRQCNVNNKRNTKNHKKAYITHHASGTRNPFKEKRTCECRKIPQAAVKSPKEPKVCEKGICESAVSDDKLDHTCKCIPEVLECDNKTCNLKTLEEPNVTRNKKEEKRYKRAKLDKSKNDIEKKQKKTRWRNKTQKIAVANNPCDGGLCKDPNNKENEKFICKCIRSTECVNTTCKPEKRKSKLIQHIFIGPLKKDNKLIKKKAKQLQVNNYYQNRISKHISPIRDTYTEKYRNERDQTGEPFFEIRVDDTAGTGTMKVGNPEVRNKIISLSKPTTTCVCKSHKKMMTAYNLPGAPCSTGICQKAVQQNGIDFPCKCTKNGFKTCTDLTCDPLPISALPRPIVKRRFLELIPPAPTPPPPPPFQPKPPLFEIQLDVDKMNIINAEEVHRNILHKKINNKQLCHTGICRNASYDKLSFLCKCVGRKPNQECTDETCKQIPSSFLDDLRTYGICKMLNTRLFTKTDNLVACEPCGTKGKRRSRRRSYYDISSKGCNRVVCSRSNKIQNNNYEKYTLGDDLTGKKHCKCCYCSNKKHNRNKKVKISKKFNEEYTIEDNRPGNLPCMCCYCLKKKTRDKNKTFLKKIKIGKKQEQTEVPEPPAKQSKLKTCCEKTLSLFSKKMEKRAKKRREQQKVFAEYEKGKKKKTAKKKKYKASSAKKFIEQEKRLNKEAKARLKEERKQKKIKEKLDRIQLKKDLETLNKQEVEENSNVCLDCTLGLFKMLAHFCLDALKIVFKTIRKPKSAYWYIKQRVSDPSGSYYRIKNCLAKYWRLRKIKIIKGINRSHALTIMIDQLKEAQIYKMFASKGKTEKEIQDKLAESKKRQKRIQERRNKALFGCRHVLLNTLRKTPFLWVYFVCPTFYPKFLRMLTFLREFGRLCLFCVALMCWTPCIVAFELCRGVVCCMFCTS